VITSLLACLLGRIPARVKNYVPDVLIYKHDFNRGNYNAIKSAFSEINWCAAFDDVG